MSLSHLTINESAAIDTWNQPRSTEQLTGFLSRLNEKDFSSLQDEFELSV